MCGVRRSRRLKAALLLVLGVAAPVRAQPRIQPSRAAFWTGMAAVVATAALGDRDARAFAERHQSRSLDRVADAVDPFGRARYLVPAIAGAYVATRVAGARPWSDAVLRIGLGYAVADGIGSAMKPMVGRRRPDALDGPWRFKPFDRRQEWHSFPSAHTVHAFALAAGISEEAHRPWASVASYGAATVVGLQRVYRGAHWSSDVAASAVLGIAASKTTNRWLRRREATGRAADRKLDVLVTPTGILCSVNLR
jgi:membrane-associated phospholipid phosphatase